MKAFLKKLELKTFKTTDGKQFKKLEFTCDVEINDKGDIRTCKGSYSEDYARKYFAYCGTTTKEAIGREVNVTLSKRNYTAQNGEIRTLTYIKFMNFLDEKGNVIIIPKADSDLDF